MKITPNISYARKVLDLHFAYTDIIVDCNIAKRFLPILADQDFSISVPTPITVHLEHCPQCQKDLRTLVDFNLRKDQLFVLSQMFTEVNNSTETIYDNMETNILLFATMDFSLISPDALKNICLHNTHRQKVLDIRSGILDKIEKSDNPVCDISFSSLFETCFPYSRKPEDVPGQSETDKLHIKSCHQCLSNAQLLLEKIGEMCSRKNSGFTTRFSLKNDVERITLASDEYKDWPIKVEKFYTKPQKVRTSQPNSNQKNINFNRLLVKYAKPISVAAGFLLICAILINIKTASAISLRDVLLALDNVKCMSIRTYKPLEKTPVRTILMSRTSKVRILDDGKKTVLFDLKSGLRKIRQNNTGEIEVSKMDESLVSSVERDLNRNWGIINDNTENASWTKVTDQVDNLPEHREVYELIFNDQSNSGTIQIQRLTIDTRNNLPQSIEVYSKQISNTRKTLQYILRIDYFSAEKDIPTLVNKFEN